MSISVIDEAALRVLRSELSHQLLMNAAAGYVLDPDLPAPEVFERPGWDLIFTPRDTWELRIAVGRPLSIDAIVGVEAIPESVLSELETVTVRPAVRCFVVPGNEPGVAYFYGLGFSVESRMFVVFRTGRGSIPKEESSWTKENGCGTR